MKPLYLITGGGSGIGRALTLGLAERGLDVLIVGRNQDKLQETQQLNPERIRFQTLDVGDEQQRQDFCRELNAGPNLAGVVHNAATIAPITSIAEIELEQWRAHFATNLEAPFFLTQQLLPKLDGGRVLNISSGVAHFAIPSWSAYCTSKAALYMLYQCFKSEFDNIAFGSVMPGIVDTNMQTEIRVSSDMPDASKQFFVDLKDQTRLLDAKTVAKFLTWLLLDVDAATFAAKEWDIYDSSHHQQWCDNQCHIPSIEEN